MEDEMPQDQSPKSIMQPVETMEHHPAPFVAAPAGLDGDFGDDAGQVLELALHERRLT
ncbi:MAG: hypothetical protein AAGJ28_03640 [Pseudomonadota bacterium]